MSRELEQRFQTAAELEQALLPFAEGEPTVSNADLVPLGPEHQGQVARRANPLELSAAAAATGVAHTVDEPPKRSLAPVISAAVAVAAIGGAGLFISLRGPSSQPAGQAPAADQTAPTQPASSADPAAIYRVQVSVRPASARVTVDGEVKQLSNGRLELSGKAGASFDVAVTDGKNHLNEKVKITDGGKSSPDELTLEPSPTPSATQSKVAARPYSTKTATTSTGKAATKTAPPAPTTTAKPTKTKSGLSYKKDW